MGNSKIKSIQVKKTMVDLATDWDLIDNKPNTFTPSSHIHDDRYYTEGEVDIKLSSKSDNGHTHSQYLTGITKDMVTNALGYIPPTQDTNTWRPLGTTADTACAGNDSRLSDARPASDVYAWAKNSTKPSYAWSEIANKPSSFSPYFANATWYLVGDDVYIGDHNVGGGFGVLGANGNTRIDFCQYNNSGNYKSITFDGATLYMNGNCDYASIAGNADTLDGYHASSFCMSNDSRLSNARPASDVYAWAKASSKPSYSWGEIANKPAEESFVNVSGGYVYWKLRNNTITIVIDIKNTVYSHGQVIYTLPGGKRPFTWMSVKNVYNDPYGYVAINTEGEIKYQNNTTTTDWIHADFTYVVD